MDEHNKRCTHPGEFIRERLKARRWEPDYLAVRMGVDVGVVTKLLNEEIAITESIAADLSRCFGTTVQFWLDLQTLYDKEKRMT